MTQNKLTTYLGNPNLKAAGVEIEWTEETLKEYKKCYNDHAYMVRKYMKLVHPDKGLINFDLYDYQERGMKLAENNRHLIAIQSRQSGKTSLATAIITPYILFNEFKTVIIVANKQATASEVLGRIKLAYEHLPKWLQSGVITWNMGNIELENGCKIETGSSSSSSIRGKSASLLYLDECLEGNTKSTYRDIITGEIFTESFLEIKNILKYNLYKNNIKHYKNNRYEVLTEDGFKPFTSLKETVSNSTIKITFGNNYINGTLNHLVKIKDGSFKTLDEIEVNDILYGDYIVESKEYLKDEIFVYDLTNVKDTNAYITNDVISHNCAFIENWQEFSASVLPVISSGKETKTIFTSTPNGLNHFYEYVDGARKGTNDYKLLEVPWWEVPGRDEAWKEETLRSLNNDAEKFAQEYENEFMGSSGTLISGSALKRLEIKHPIHKSHVDHGELNIYEEPKRGNNYVLMADVSRGKGLDYSAFSIFDITEVPYRQVATYRSNIITPVDYASVIEKIHKYYNEAYALIEINDIGGQVVDVLMHDFEIENMFYTESAGRAGKRISSGFGRNVEIGVRTTKQVKATGCSVLKLLIEQEKLIINDAETIHELSTFSQKGGSYQAEAGRHDDLVMGLVLFAWTSTSEFFQELNDINTMNALRERSEDEIKEELLGFLTYDDLDDEFEEVRYL